MSLSIFLKRLNEQSKWTSWRTLFFFVMDGQQKREKNKGKEKKRKCSPSSQCLLKPSLEKEALLSQPKWWVVRSSRPNSEVVLRNGVNEVKIPFKTRQRGGGYNCFASGPSQFRLHN